MHTEMTVWFGMFIVKTGYHQAVHADNSDPGNSSLIPGNFWNMFWKIQTFPTKCLNLAWRACKNILPVMKNQQGRGNLVDTNLWEESMKCYGCFGMKEINGLSIKTGFHLAAIYRDHNGDVLAAASLLLPNCFEPI